MTWKCPYCISSNLSTDRSCPSCGCMQQDAPKPINCKERQAARLAAQLVPTHPKPWIPIQPEPIPIEDVASFVPPQPKYRFGTTDVICFGLLAGVIALGAVLQALGL